MGQALKQRIDTCSSAWLHGANPDVYASGRVCITAKHTLQKVFVKKLDLVWADRIDTNGEDTFAGWIENRFGNYGDFYNWFFNIEINWTIENKTIYP